MNRTPNAMVFKQITSRLMQLRLKTFRLLLKNRMSSFIAEMYYFSAQAMSRPTKSWILIPEKKSLDCANGVALVNLMRQLNGFGKGNLRPWPVTLPDLKFDVSQMKSCGGFLFIF